MDSPKKIVFVHPSLTRMGTAERILFHQIQVLQNLGHSVDIITAELTKGCKEKCESEEIPVTLISSWFTRLTEETKGAVKKAGSKLRPILREYSVVVSHSTLGMLWVAQTLNRDKPLPFVFAWCIHKSPLHYFEVDAPKSLLKLKPLLDAAVVQVTHFFPSSTFSSNHINRLFNLTTKPHPFGIDLPMMNPLLQERFKSKFTIGCVSDLEPGKNVRLLIESFDYFLRIHPKFKGQVTLEIIGEGTQKPMLLNFAQECGLADSIQFLGWVDESELRRKYQQWELVLLVPLQAPMSRVVLEAGLYGKPIIASAQGGIKEAVQDGVTGFLVDPTSPQEIADSLYALCSDPSAVFEMGRQAQDYVFRNFDAQEIDEDWVKTGLL